MYDFWTKNEDTKLIACAGSGKSKSIIEKVRYLINNNIITKKNYLIFSFSKLTINSIK